MNAGLALIWGLPLGLGGIAYGVWMHHKTELLRRQLAEAEGRYEQARQSEARFQAIADFTYGVEAWVDSRGKLIWVNRSIERMTGYTPFECLLLPAPLELLVSREYRRALRQRLGRALAQHQDGGMEARMQHRDGGQRWVSLSWRAVSSKSGGELGLRISAEDIDARKQTEQLLLQQATRDPLTGLYNRRRFQEELARMLAEAIRRDITIGLLAIDLDGFKPINDRYGHQAGDEVLVTLAREVGGTIRKAEIFFRLGGDEFAVLVADTNPTDMAGLAQRIKNRIADLQFRFDGQPVTLTASLGIAMFPDHADSADVLLAEADRALYAAKEQGKNTFAAAR